MTRGEFPRTRGEFPRIRGEFSLPRGKFSLTRGEFSLTRGEFSLKSIMKIGKDGDFSENDYLAWSKQIFNTIEHARLSVSLKVNEYLLELYHTIGTEIIQKQEKEGGVLELSSVFLSICKDVIWEKVDFRNGI
jgi:hypothetical protein